MVSFKTTIAVLYVATSSCVLALALTGQSNLIAYWGQGLNKASFPFRPETSLATLCATTKYNIIHIKGILSYATVKGFPGIDFNNHCSFPLNAFHNWQTTSPNGLSLLNCPAVGADIQTCQGMGKKIILVIDPLDFMSANSSALPNGAAAVAQNIWNLFLGGTSPWRPFGPNVKLDGIDFHIWSNNPIGVVDLVTIMRQQLGSNYLMSISPRCAWPDYLVQQSNFQSLAPLFDYVTVFFLSTSSVCGFSDNPSGFWTTLGYWSQYVGTIPLVVGLSSWTVDAVIQATPGDYVSPGQWVGEGVVSGLKQNAVNFAGVALMDGEF
ncbi:hypothetical protein HDU98_009166 [Podochytrium sp. JEL0797]|nr:hypothetical protein HDU98_009166 [Podochytrium sp. JEL0797]